MNCEGQTANNYCPCVLQTSLHQVGIIPSIFLNIFFQHLLYPLKMFAVYNNSYYFKSFSFLFYSFCVWLFLYWERAGEGVSGGGGGGGGDGGGGDGSGGGGGSGLLVRMLYVFLVLFPYLFFFVCHCVITVYFTRIVIVRAVYYINTT